MAENSAPPTPMLVRLTYAWIALFFILCIFFWDLDFLLQQPFYWVLVILGGYLIYKASAMAYQTRKRIISVAILCIVIVLPILFFNGLALRGGVWLRFYLGKLNYENHVAKILASNPNAAIDETCSGRCRLNRSADGTIKQIFFPLQKVGSFFGWHAFVYDPSQEILQVYKANMGDTGISPKFRWNHYFNCSVYEVVHLTGNWYLCGFGHS